MKRRLPLKAYFIGIAGKAMAGLAKAFKDNGWQVSGSDQHGVYPPISTYLRENAIPFVEGYSQGNVPQRVDLVVVGRSALLGDPRNPEYRQAKQLGCPVLSYPETLAKYLIKKQSIVITGTYGKTTISALVAWTLRRAQLNPSYMVGGLAINLKDGVRLTQSEYSVVEGDESPALRETDPPKFMYYRPKFLLITATKWDHPEVFKNPQAYLRAYLKLVRSLPADGLLVYEKDRVDRAVLTVCRCRSVGYSVSNPRADYLVDSVELGERTSLLVKMKSGPLSLQTTLLGRANLENIAGAVALTKELGLTPRLIQRSVTEFRGLKTHLEFLGKQEGVSFYWDIAQHPLKVKGALQALREHFPKHQIICVFHPFMSGLRYSESLAWYPGAFDLADLVIISRVSFTGRRGERQRVTGPMIARAIARTQKQVYYEPLSANLIKRLKEAGTAGAIIVFMSSGGAEFVRLIETTIKEFRAR